MDTADVDGDGHLDLVTSDFDGQELAILRGRGDGTFGPARGFVGDHRANTVMVVDFDGDGDADVLSGVGPDVSIQAGMFVPCALPHDMRSFLPYKRCVLSVPDGNEQSLTCGDTYLF